MGAVSVVFLAVCGFQGGEVAREALKGYRLPWSGFAAGSSVTYRETLLRPQISDEGKLVYKEIEIESVWTLNGGLGEPMKLRIVGGGRESNFALNETLPGWARGKGERKPDETVKVGDTEYACSVTTITFGGGGDAGRVATIYRSPEAPTWAVRRRVETFVKGKRNTLEEEVLVEARRRVKVGDRELVCQVFRTTIETPGGARTVHTDLRSDAVPGRLVRRETRHYQRDHEVRGAATKKEVVTFITKK